MIAAWWAEIGMAVTFCEDDDDGDDDCSLTAANKSIYSMWLSLAAAAAAAITEADSRNTALSAQKHKGGKSLQF